MKAGEVAVDFYESAFAAFARHFVVAAPASQGPRFAGRGSNGQ
jgi:hypothetical protein